MTAETWNLDESNGELLIRTGVAGRAAKMGHRLTIAMTAWRAEIKWADHPVGVELTVDVDSLQVLRGEGGVTPLSGPEKGVARANALKTLDAGRYPQVSFRASDIAETDDGYRLTGTLEIHGTARDRVIDVQVEDLGDTWRITGEAEVRQTEFGVKPYSMLMGSMKVADAVTVSLVAELAKD